MTLQFATSSIDLDDCTAHSFRVKPQQGGTCEVDYIVDCPDAHETVFAKLAKYKKREVDVRFEQHEPAQSEIKPDSVDAGKSSAPRKPGAAEKAAVAKAKAGKGEPIEDAKEVVGDQKPPADGNADGNWPFPGKGGPDAATAAFLARQGGAA